MHCILQIIINRVSLVMVSKSQARYLKWGVFSIVVVINISVFCIWIPARLQINAKYIQVNDIWDRTEKAIFAVVDASLNCYFMWTVRTNLISAGLVKYQALFRFNLVMVCLSVALDVSFTRCAKTEYPI
jgi:ethanolamine transporter EutH